MQHMIRIWTGMLLTAASVSVAACGSGRQQNTAAGDVNAAQTPAQPYATPTTASPTDTATPVDTLTRTHHSKLKGAIVGAVIGHYAGHHALAGAAAGAMVQHERNKHP